MASKSALRDRALAGRDALDASHRADASRAIAERAIPLVASLAPSCVAGYVAMRSECDAWPILHAAHLAGSVIGLPVVAPGQTLAFRRYEPGHKLIPGGFGTMVPVDREPAVEPDLIVVPVVGFDRTGIRLGYGKGHYDRAIAGMRARGLAPRLLGIAFSAQQVDNIPHEPHDVRLDWIVTEKEILLFTHAASGSR